MARRRKVEEHANHEAWAIPYGDLVTLLMAFFVVMYAISVVDAGKYRVLSNSLVEAFGSQVPVDPIQIGEPSLELNLLTDDVRRSLAPFEIKDTAGESRQSERSELEPLSPTDVAIEGVLDGVSEEGREEMLREIAEMSEEIENALGRLNEEGDIQVKRKPYWLEITINTNLLFGSGSATLEPAARPVLQDVARILSKRDARIHVEGHTDDRPISNSIYPSNWELSSGRAATVVNLFAQNGVDPRRMVAIGYAEYQPLADNDTEEGRSQNRRVEVIVLPGPSPHRDGTSEPERLRRDYEEGIGELR
ncbi:flagellar motor protein MotD [Imhoffiella purpurea]|uniref:Flagellar motor rotation protein MotB n=1 Tax=Imhoffiella purpurea TaxID=1249627 RepID=W9VLD1_9GAMM|nr:flagellar motor protein MotD [Imhoffiella purpurea]EXJ16892.1 Flagellar motor rotation protein MotB [Imhoffiella purpurea]